MQEVGLDFVCARLHQVAEIVVGDLDSFRELIFHVRQFGFARSQFLHDGLSRRTGAASGRGEVPDHSYVPGGFARPTSRAAPCSGSSELPKSATWDITARGAGEGDDAEPIGALGLVRSRLGDVASRFLW